MSTAAMTFDERYRAIESRDAAAAQRAAELHVRCAERAAMVVLQAVDARPAPKNTTPTRR